MYFTDDRSEMMLSVLVILIGYYVYSMRQKRKNFPPGPIGVPILGYAPFLGEKVFETYTQLSKKYGNIYSLKLGEETWVVLNSYDVIYEALVTHADVFSGRPQVHMYYKFTRGKGIGLVDYGPFYKEQRKFGVKNLKRFGFGKVHMEDVLAEEVQFLVDEIAARDEQAFNCHELISSATGNVICRMAFGKRFGYDDAEFNQMLKLMNAGFGSKLDGKLFHIMVIAPLTRFLPVFWSSYNRIAKSRKILIRKMQQIIDEHRRTYDPNLTRDFIDEFIKEINERRNEKNSTFDGEQLTLYVADLLVAGSETTASTLRWCVLCFATFPEIQEKVFQEISRVVGDGRPPNLTDKDNLPYASAFIHEIMRHRMILPIFLPHKTSHTISFRGFQIPKNTPILANMWSVIFNPNLFEQPHQFRPERFLDKSGKFVPSCHVVPFSFGPRYCLGEKLARAEVFLFLTGVVQRFTIVEDHESPLPSFYDGIHGGVHAPHEFKVTFKQR